MMKQRMVVILFAVLAAVQLAAPLYMAWRWEDILQTGTVYKWRTAPVDPYDALRGRYIDLWFKDTRGPAAPGENFKNGQTVYASFATDAEGFARITAVSATKPAGGDYVEARAGYFTAATGMWTVMLPFKRFYMREDLAPLAERAYQRTAGKDAVVTVRIKGGLGVIEQLYIGDKTIDEYLRGQPGN
jgi:uncharacterized membrane-anchored protein